MIAFISKLILSYIVTTVIGTALQIREWTRAELMEKGQVDYAHSLTAPVLEYLELHYNHTYIPLKLGIVVYATDTSNQVTIDFA